MVSGLVVSRTYPLRVSQKDATRNVPKKADPMSEQRAFMSNSTDDRPLLRSALNWLRESELRAAQIDDPADWGAVGNDVRDVISDRIRRADTLVLAWSDRAAKSAWVQYEVGWPKRSACPYALSAHAIEEASLSTLLEDLMQRLRVEEQIQQVRAMLGVTPTAAGRTTGVAGNGKKWLLSAAARKRIATAHKRR
jgi:hypothetical protein